MKAYITKHALASGVYPVEGERCDDGRMLKVIEGPHVEYYYKPDWHETEAEALDRVLDMVAPKLRTLDDEKSRLIEILTGCHQGVLPMQEGNYEG